MIDGCGGRTVGIYRSAADRFDKFTKIIFNDAISHFERKAALSAFFDALDCNDMLNSPAIVGVLVLRDARITGEGVVKKPVDVPSASRIVSRLGDAGETKHLFQIEFHNFLAGCRAQLHPYRMHI
ncbi:hypothetical protein CV103_11400 [Sphingomonas fennica]|uniref:Uncharacterized protein n=1 Tax=Edaphosphingomonas fennica TaxID=114404 RepID=A0A2T4HX97_9SPHN|nr:hypothetical protein CV103_11400 [Sphingomonas fennica]